MTRIILLFLLTVFSLTCRSREATNADLFSVGLLVADHARIGAIDEIKPRDPSDQLGYFDVIVSTPDGSLDLISDDPSFNEKYSKGKAGFVFLTREYKTLAGNERRLLLPSPWMALYPLPAGDGIDIDSIRAEADRVASGYLRSAVCDENYKKTVDALAGRDAQRIVKEMYGSRPLKAGQLACLMGVLKSTRPTRIDELEVPWKSREGVYHGNFQNLGYFVRSLIPQLMNFPAPANDKLPIEKVELAWAYWGAVGALP